MLPHPRGVGRRVCSPGDHEQGVVRSCACVSVAEHLSLGWDFVRIPQATTRASSRILTGGSPWSVTTKPMHMSAASKGAPRGSSAGPSRALFRPFHVVGGTVQESDWGNAKACEEASVESLRRRPGALPRERCAAPGRLHGRALIPRGLIQDSDWGIVRGCDGASTEPRRHRGEALLRDLPRGRHALLGLALAREDLIRDSDWGIALQCGAASTKRHSRRGEALLRVLSVFIRRPSRPKGASPGDAAAQRSGSRCGAHARKRAGRESAPFARNRARKSAAKLDQSEKN
jgi:hypothetical protein